MRVIQASNFRESSIPPESALRSHSWKLQNGAAGLRVSALGALPEHPLSDRANKRQKIRNLDVVDDSLDEQEGAAGNADRELWLGGGDGYNGLAEEEEQDGTHGGAHEAEQSFQRVYSPELGEEIRPISMTTRALRSADVEITGASQLSPGRLNELFEPQVKNEEFSPPGYRHTESRYESPQQNVGSSMESDLASQHGSQARPRYRPSPVSTSATANRRKTNTSFSATPREPMSHRKKDVYDMPSTDEDEDNMPTPRASNRLPASKNGTRTGPGHRNGPQSPSIQLEHEFSRSSQVPDANRDIELRRSAAQKAIEDRCEKERIEKERIEKERIEKERIEKERIEREEAEARANAERLKQVQEKREKEAVEAQQRAAKAAEERKRIAREQQAQLDSLEKEEEERLVKEETAKSARLAKEEEQRILLEKKQVEETREAERKALVEKDAERIRQAEEEEEDKRRKRNEAAKEKRKLVRDEKERKAREEKKKKADEAARKLEEENARKAQAAREQEEKEADAARELEEENARKAQAEAKEKHEKDIAEALREVLEKEEAAKAMKSDPATKKRGRRESSVDNQIPSSNNINKKVRTGSPSATPSVERDMGPPPVPNSGMKRSNLKKDPSLEPPSTKKRNSVSFVEENSANQMIPSSAPSMMSTPTPNPRDPAKRTPIVCPLPTKPVVNGANTRSRSLTVSNAPPKKMLESESESESGSSESESEDEVVPAAKEMEPPQSTQPEPVLRRTGAPTTRLASKAAAKITQFQPDSDVEMEDVPLAANTSKAPTAMETKKQAPTESSDSETDSSDGETVIYPSKSPSKPESSDSSDEDSDDDLEESSALNSLRGKPKPSMAALVKQRAGIIAPGTPKAVSKLSTLERLEDGDVSFDVRDMHPPSSQAIRASQPLIQMNSQTAKTSDSDDESSEEEDESSESESDSDSGSGKKQNSKTKKPTGGIPDHKKAGSIKKKAPSVMGFGRRFSGVC